MNGHAFAKLAAMEVRRARRIDRELARAILRLVRAQAAAAARREQDEARRLGQMWWNK